MIKQNKLKTVISTLAILLPIFVGLILWDKLPETIATHFGIDNNANGWSSKGFAVFGIPLVMAALHLFCLVVTSLDPKHKNIGKKPLGMVFWIIPSVSLVVMSVIYAMALGVNINVGFVCLLLIGALLVVMGNLLPKAKQNYTFGIKVPWALDDEDNWNKTHRLAGFCMVIAGLITLLTAFLQNPFIFFPVIAAALVVPIAYSYIHYKKHSK
ncbi:MAG: SdpI family protein [Oscillospiraceae bacterium]|nr:SdpI family protein [Oscillospiraceae bacterium]